jgi:hypothetical protein
MLSICMTEQILDLSPSTCRRQEHKRFRQQLSPVTTGQLIERLSTPETVNARQDFKTFLKL